MHKNLLLAAATVAILCAGSLASISAQAAPRTTAAKSGKAVTVQHRTARSDITSFSSSSAPAALNVGVNHPAKK
jgi:hypothetical protein